MSSVEVVVGFKQSCLPGITSLAAAAHCEQPSSRREAEPVKYDTMLEQVCGDADQLHFPELDGESGEGSCCEFLTSLSIALERACARQPAAAEGASCSGRPSPFHGARVPAIPLAAYIQRISRYSKCSNVCFVMALSYMQRLAQADARYALSLKNVHRMLITGVLLSAKLMDDSIYNNCYWAKIGGISVAELSALELHMLRQLDYRLFVGEEEVAHRLREVKVLARGSLECSTAPRR